MQEIPQSETTPFYPRSPYGVAKLYAYWITVNYREAYNIFACNGILFNHESPRRGEIFVTRKITMAFARISLGVQKYVSLGNLDAKRDWGHARDYVEMMWLMLQQKKPGDYVASTNKQISVREFVELCAKKIGKKITWKGSGENEVGYDQNNNILVKVNKKYYRPSEVETLLGDNTKALNQLGWSPKIDIETLVDEMMDADLNRLKNETLSVEPIKNY